MPNDTIAALSGTVSHVFAHRFVLDGDGTTHLADLGPKGLQAFPLEVGLAVTIDGDRRPSEIKVTRISAPGRAPVDIHHKTPSHPPGKPVPDDRPDFTALALAAARKAGWTPEGEPSRKPKHVELLARQAGGPWTELHIDPSGTIHKTRPADPAKWQAAKA